MTTRCDETIEAARALLDEVEALALDALHPISVQSANLRQTLPPARYTLDNGTLLHDGEALMYIGRSMAAPDWFGPAEGRSLAGLILRLLNALAED